MTNNEERCQAVLNVGDNQIQCTIPDREHEGDHKNITRRRIWKQGVTRAAPPIEYVPRSDKYPKTTDEHRKLIKKVASHWPYMESSKSNAYMVFGYAKAYGKRHRDAIQDLERAEEFCHMLLDALMGSSSEEIDNKITECARYFGREDIAKEFGDGEIPEKELSEVVDMYDSGD